MRFAPHAPAFNAVCLYILACLLTIVLHEGGHAAMALPAPHPAVVANMCMSTMVLRRAYARGQRAPVQPAVALAPPRLHWGLLAALVLAAGFRLLRLGVAL